MSIYNSLKKHRDALMGIAILYIVLFHAEITFPFTILEKIRATGYGGVDIFLFCSGFGIAHSLFKNPDAAEFCKRRFTKLAPTYYIFIIAFFVFKLTVNGSLSISSVIGNLTLTGWWAGLPDQFNWYVQALPLYYITAPIIFSLVNKKSNVSSPVKNTVSAFVLVAISCIAGIAFFGETSLMAISRLPVFIIGIFAGCHMINNQAKGTIKSSVLPFVICTVLMLAGFALMFRILDIGNDKLWHYGLWWYPFIIIAPCMSVFITVLFDFLSKIKLFDFLIKIVGIIGKSSFEIYLIHVTCFEYLNGIGMSGLLKWTVAAIACTASGIGYHYALSWLVQKIKCKKKQPLAS